MAYCAPTIWLAVSERLEQSDRHAESETGIAFRQEDGILGSGEAPCLISGAQDLGHLFRQPTRHVQLSPKRTAVTHEYVKWWPPNYNPRCLGG